MSNENRANFHRALSKLRSVLARAERTMPLSQPVRSWHLYGDIITMVKWLIDNLEPGRTEEHAIPDQGADRYALKHWIDQLLAAVAHTPGSYPNTTHEIIELTNMVRATVTAAGGKVPQP